MNPLNSLLLIFVSLVQYGNAVLYDGEWDVFWEVPEGSSITFFQTTLRLPIHMAATIYQQSIHAISPWISSPSYQSLDVFETDDGYYQTYNITLQNDGQPYQMQNLVYPGDSITSTWTPSASTSWANTISVVPGVYGLGNKSRAYSVNHMIPISGNVTRAGFELFLYDVLWDFGDIVWTNTTIETDSEDESWCTNWDQTQSVGTVYDNPVPFPNITFEFPIRKQTMESGGVTCYVGEVTLVQPDEDAYVPNGQWNSLYGNGTPNPYY